MDGNGSNSRKFKAFSGVGRRLDGKKVPSNSPTHQTRKKLNTNSSQPSFVPFAGQGHRLGGSPGMNVSLANRHSFSGLLRSHSNNTATHNVVTTGNPDFNTAKREISMTHQRNSKFGHSGSGNTRSQGVIWHYDIKSKANQGNSGSGNQYLHAFPRTGSPNTLDIPPQEITYLKSYDKNRNKDKSPLFSADPSKGKAPKRYQTVGNQSRSYIREYEQRRSTQPNTNLFSGFGQTLGSGNTPSRLVYSPPSNVNTLNQNKPKVTKKPFTPFSGKGHRLGSKKE